ncbi:MAG: MBL fold metallo-hydrolase, partial [Alkalinema sp. RL_2_19]|nr:MBL fold metallo-hydrolase [Alkalinema sp. RL_2_19]
ALNDGQSILLPVPTIGLGQELLFLLRSHYLFSGRDLDIWVNGVVAQGCDTYLSLMSQFPIAVQNFAQNQALFWDDKVQPRVRRGVPPKLEASDSESSDSEPSDSEPSAAPRIVLTDARADFSQVCNQGKWLVLFAEATAATFGEVALVREAPLGAVDFGQAAVSTDHPTVSEAIVTAEIYWLSEHSDGNTTLQLIHSLRPQHVLFVHGSPEALADFANLEELSGRYKIHLPHPGSLLELPLADDRAAASFTTVPETRYEGEVAETTAEILISLPIDVTTDERWQRFADTGMVEAGWLGDELVIRGLAPQEITGANRNPTAQSRSCFHCQFYQSQRCSNPDSSLFQLQVTPEGYCLEFQVGR